MIWNVGLPKTGTVSLNKAIWRLGYRLAHSDPATEENVTKAGMATFKDLKAAMNGFNGGNEMPFVRKFYRRIYKVDPEPKFILTHRDCMSWKASMEWHRKNNSHRRLWPIFENPGAWDDIYHEHTNAVLTFFDDKECFLFMDIFDGDGYELLAPFLGETAQENWEFPHENKSAKS